MDHNGKFPFRHSIADIQKWIYGKYVVMTLWVFDTIRAAPIASFKTLKLCAKCLENIQNDSMAI